jgi:hypothetical protein
MENIGIFYERFEYFTAIWYTYICYIRLCTLVCFYHFGMFGPRKIWQPCSPPLSRSAFILFSLHVKEC